MISAGGCITGKVILSRVPTRTTPEAREIRRERFAAPFVLVEKIGKAIAGYYALSATGIRLGQLPRANVQRLPAYPVVAATLLGHLAVDQRLLGTGLSEHLLMDALHRTWIASLDVASFAVVVDARDDAARAFYLRYDLIPFTAETRRLFLPIKTVGALFQ